MQKVNCPVCNGTGKIKPPRFDKDKMQSKIKAAKELRKAGFSIREIMRLLNYKSPLSITYLLNKNN